MRRKSGGEPGGGWTSTNRVATNGCNAVLGASAMMTSRTGEKWSVAFDVISRGVASRLIELQVNVDDKPLIPRR